MHLSNRTLEALGQVITGAGRKSPSRSGPKLLRFFNAFGADDRYPSGGGFPSHWSFAEDKRREFNDSPTIKVIVEAAVNPTDYVGTDFDCDEVVAHLNEYLAVDDLALRRGGRCWKLRRRGETLVRVESVGEPADPLTHEFIHEQLTKCQRKLNEGDYDGAITDARALTEGVLREIEIRVTGSATDTKGDLARHYKAVQKLLHLEPDRKDIAGSLRQMLSGLVSIVHGISAARNSMSDAHARTYRPAAHHARLVVNAAQTLADFLLASYEVQREKGMPDEGGSGL